MIVYTSDDTVKLSGALTRNQWPTIQAAARVLMKEHPEGILIDAGELTSVSPEGARTFLEAMKDIQSAGARIVVCNLPPAAMDVLKTVPGVRSQLALSMSVEQARDSLRWAVTCADGLPAGSVIVPLLDGADVAHAVRLAALVARERGLQVGLLGFIVVPRDLPLGAPLPEQETQMQTELTRGAESARNHVAVCAAHVARVRDLRDGLISALADSRAAMVVLAMAREAAAEEGLLDLARDILQKAACDVLVARCSPVNGGGLAR